MSRAADINPQWAVGTNNALLTNLLFEEYLLGVAVRRCVLSCAKSALTVWQSRLNRASHDRRMSLQIKNAVAEVTLLYNTKLVTEKKNNTPSCFQVPDAIQILPASPLQLRSRILWKRMVVIHFSRPWRWHRHLYSYHTCTLYVYYQSLTLCKSWQAGCRCLNLSVDLQPRTSSKHVIETWGHLTESLCCIGANSESNKWAQLSPQR